MSADELLTCPPYMKKSCNILGKNCECERIPGVASPFDKPAPIAPKAAPAPAPKSAAPAPKAPAPAPKAPAPAAPATPPAAKPAPAAPAGKVSSGSV
jgi:hypothetical protein